MSALPEYGAKDVVYILDLNCWVYRFWATVQGRCAHAFIEMVDKVLRTRAPSHFAVCRDLPFPTFRSALYPRREGTKEGYKAQREAPDPTLLERLRWSAEMVQDVFGIPVYAAKGFEADDLIASLTRQAKERGMRVVLLALDKDLMQLVDERCVMWDGKQRVVGPAEVEEKMGVRPDQLRDYLSIVGDASDNVPGVYGCGPVAATRILKKYGSIEAARAVFTESTSKDPDLLRLRMYGPELALSQQLVTLAHDAPVTFNPEELKR